MKWVLVALFLLLVPAGHASLQEWNTEISLNDDKTSDWVSTFVYNETVEKSDLFLLTGVSSFNVTADGEEIECEITRRIGTSIECENLNATTIEYRAKSYFIISSLQNLNIFSNRISVTQPVEKMKITIKLPFGTALTEEENLAGTGLNPFEPSGARQTSDGRRIFVVWEFFQPGLGDTYDFTVVYEPVTPGDFNVFIVIIAGVIIAFLIFLVLFFRRGRVEEILPVLTDNERKVMEIVLRDKHADQRKIVKETDFSKPKVSRIIQDLEKRGLIEKKVKGRTNIISLKKQKKKQK